MRKVLHFRTGPYLHLTENWIYGQLAHLTRYFPVVYACSTRNLHLFPVVKVRALGLEEDLFRSSLLRKLFFYAYFSFFLIKDKPDVVHAHFGPSGYRFLPFCKLRKTPLITSFYGYDVNQLVHNHPAWKKKYRQLFMEGDLFLIEGNHVKQCLIELGCPEKKLIVQHLGVDLQTIKFVPRTIQENGEIQILMAASFREKKGLSYGVEAFGQFRNLHPEIKATLTIIGDSSGSLEEENQKRLIFDKINEYHMGGSVRMLGYQSHDIFIRELYRAHIFLSPSVHASDGDTEGGAPVSIIEASASGMPVISTHHCDIPEVIIDGKSGFLGPERDADFIAAKLKFLVSNSHIWPATGRYGRERMEQHYDVRKQAELLEGIYDSIVKA